MGTFKSAQNILENKKKNKKTKIRLIFTTI